MASSLESEWSILDHVNALTITVAIAVILVTLAIRSVVRPSRLPPGPRGWPFVGSIFAMTDSPEVVFGRLSKQYGDIFGLRIGERWMVVLSGQELIKDALHNHGVKFAGRPIIYSSEIITDGFKDIIMSPYSDTWKFHRKLAHVALRHFATGQPLQDLISGVYPKIEKELAEVGERPVNPKLLLNLLMYNILSQMCFGKSYELHNPAVVDFMNVVDEVNEEFGLGLAADFFSWARYVPTSGPRMIRRNVDRYMEYLRTELQEYKERYDPENINDIYSLLLKAQEDAINAGEHAEKLTDTHLIQTLSNIFGAGIKSSVETLYWTIALVTEHPEVQTKVHEEIDTVIGRGRVPTIEDRGSLPYTEATMYEVLRYSSIAPTSVPHTALEDTEFHGYVIPKDAFIMFNTYSMHFDPSAWTDPQAFRPEHFLDPSGTVRQHPSSFLPFGTGRRACLGEAVAKADLFLISTWLMQNYSFSKAPAAPGREAESLINTIPKTAAGRVLRPYEVVIKRRELPSDH